MVATPLLIAWHSLVVFKYESVTYNAVHVHTHYNKKIKRKTGHYILFHLSNFAGYAMPVDHISRTNLQTTLVMNGKYMWLSLWKQGMFVSVKNNKDQYGFWWWK